MKKALTLSAIMAAFIAGGTLMPANFANAADTGAAPALSKAADIAKKGAEAKSALESAGTEQPAMHPDDIAAKAKEKASDKIDQVKRDMKEKAKEQANEKIEEIKDKAGLNQAKEAGPVDKATDIKSNMPTGEKKSPADLLKDMKKR